MLTESFKEYPWICIKRPSCWSSRAELDLPVQWGQPEVWCELNPARCLWRKWHVVLSERWALLCLGKGISPQAALYRYILLKMLCCHKDVRTYDARAVFIALRAISLDKQINPNRGRHAWNCNPSIPSSYGFSDLEAFQWTMGDRFISHLKSPCSVWLVRKKSPNLWATTHIQKETLRHTGDSNSWVYNSITSLIPEIK